MYLLGAVLIVTPIYFFILLPYAAVGGETSYELFHQKFVVRVYLTVDITIHQPSFVDATNHKIKLRNFKIVLNVNGASGAR